MQHVGRFPSNVFNVGELCISIGNSLLSRMSSSPSAQKTETSLMDFHGLSWGWTNTHSSTYGSFRIVPGTW